jgi:hypothetical protein
MEIIQGDMWEEVGKADLILVTTNAAIRKDGALVMGRGAAAQAKEMFPQLPFELGRRLKQSGLIEKEYGITVTGISTQGTLLGAFQVKYHWRDEADLNLIRFSCRELARYAGPCPRERIVVNYPGIGNGRLTRDDVEPILKAGLGKLDNVFIYWR